MPDQESAWYARLSKYLVVSLVFSSKPIIMTDRVLTGCIFEKGPSKRGRDCPICHEHITTNRRTIRHAKCRTVFCKPCLDAWTCEFKKASCPICRGVIVRRQRYTSRVVIDDSGDAGFVTVRTILTPVSDGVPETVGQTLAFFRGLSRVHDSSPAPDYISLS